MNWRRFLESASRPALELASRPVLGLASGRALDLALAALLVAVVWPAAAFADGAAVKCAPNEERVWLYDSVTSLNVETKLKCGESVEVIGQQSGYVKVRTANGTEGFLPESNLPKLPVAGDASGAQPVPGAPPTLASAARAAAAARRAAAAAPASATTSVTAVEMAPPAGAVNASPAMQPKTVAAVAATPSSASTTTSAPTSAVASAPVSATPVSTTVSSTSATPAAAIPATAHPLNVASTAPSTATAAAAAHAKPKTASKSATSTTVTTSAKAPSGNPAGSANPSGVPVAPAPRPATSAPLHVAAATPAPKAPSAQPAAVVATDIYVGGPSNSPAPKAAANAPKVRTVAATSDDDDDSYLTRPKNESDDPSCQTYFSGYGLSPGQFKWLVENRVKKYPSICPAASPEMVDYVIIFTHDVDFFNYTMPAPVHYEAGGFSDWAPILQYDTSVVSHSDIDKSKREYVWVFHVKRGAFDPNKFSPHRRFQYTKTESKYSKTVEDAFEFIGGQGAER
jgi:hypothetical protein